MTTEDLATAHESCIPAQSFFRPGETGSVRLRLRSRSGHVRLTVKSLHGTVFSDEVQARDGDNIVSFPLPTDVGRGYGVEVAIVDSHGALIDRRRTAVDVQRSWMDVPRYAFLTDFSPDEAYEDRCDWMLARHVTAVQFYDWMYRHFQFLPPNDHFTDALGRRLSLASVRGAIQAVHERGMAALAYGALYGAEPEYALAHPEELLYDERGIAISLVEMFYITDLRPGPWRDRILVQFRQAVDLGFDGIHADQYGFPEHAWDHKGIAFDMAPVFADIVAAAQAAVTGAGGDGVIFNHVRNWPLESVAPVRQCCTYIEVWPPDTTLADLVRLIEQAQSLAPDRRVILAAYMSCATSNPAAAEDATLLAATAIHASGGFHLLLGEGDAILADPYYPNFVRPPARFQQRLSDHWDFVVRYGAYLYDPTLRPWDGEPVEVDGVWALYRVSERFSTLSIINVSPCAQWDAIAVPRPEHRNVAVSLPVLRPVQGAYATGPDLTGDAVPLAFECTASHVRFAVPSVKTWTLIVIEHESSEYV